MFYLEMNEEDCGDDGGAVGELGERDESRHRRIHFIFIYNYFTYNFINKQLFRRYAN